MNFLIILLLWQSAIAYSLNFTYIDEIVTLGLGIYFLCALVTKHFIMQKYEAFAFCSIIAFYIAGAISTIIFNYQGSILYGLESGLFSIKSFVCYFGSRAWLCNKKISKRTLLQLLTEIEVPLMVVATLLIFDQFVAIFPASTVRFGIKTSSFIFSHPVELSCYGILSLLLSIYLRSIMGMKRKFWRNYLPSIITVFIAGRYKAIGFMVLFLAARLILPLVKKFKLRYFIITLPLVIAVTYNQLAYYLSDLVSNARGALYFYSFIKKECVFFYFF